MKINARIKSTEQDDKKISILLSAFFSFNIVCLIINTICNCFAPNTPVDTAICAAVYCLLIANALPAVCRRLSFADLLFFLGAALVTAVCALCFPENRSYISDGLLRLFVLSLPLFFLGRAIRDYRQAMDMLISVSYWLILAAFVYYVVLMGNDENLADDNMSFAYYLLPHCLFCGYSMMQKFRPWKLLIFLLGFATLFSCGTRGPLVCLLAGMMAFLFFVDINPRVKLIAVFLLAAAVLLVLSGAFERFLQWLSSTLSSIGVSNRILDKTLNQEFTLSEERNDIYALLSEAIGERPFFGYGVYGDRILLEGTEGLYAHSIFFELVCDFGIIAGTLLFLTVVLGVVFAFCRKDDGFRPLLCTMVCCGLLKLFLSASYLSDAVFYLMLGLAFQKKTPVLPAKKQGESVEKSAEASVV